MENFSVPSGCEDWGRRAVLLGPGKEAEGGILEYNPVSSCLGSKQNLKHGQGCLGAGGGLLKSLPALMQPLPHCQGEEQLPGLAGISAALRWMGHPWRDATVAPVEAAYSITSPGLGPLSHHPLPRFSPFTGGASL